MKDDLIKSLWPDSFVEESNLTRNIFVLRNALGETAQDAHDITTLPGRGYRFTEKVRFGSTSARYAKTCGPDQSITRVVIDEGGRFGASCPTSFSELWPISKSSGPVDERKQLETARKSNKEFFRLVERRPIQTFQF